MASSKDFIVKRGIVVKTNTTVPSSNNLITTNIVRSPATPSLNLNFTRATSLDSRLSFTRASGATYVGSNGYISYSTNNQPRFDYDPVTGQPLGLLIEEQRTNAFTYSSAFSNWGKSLGLDTVIDNAAISPDGYQTASYVNANGTTNSYLNGTFATATSGTTYTKSIFGKAGTTSNVIFECPDNNGSGGTAYFQSTFNLTTGIVTANASGNTAIITPYSNGWYRCSVTRTYSLNSSAGTIYIGAYGTGNGSVYLWGAQFEVGAQPSTYIPTTSASVTRAADRCLLSAGSWYTPNQGTWYAEYQGGRESTQGFYGRVLSPGSSYTILSTDGGVTSNVGTWGGVNPLVLPTGADYWTTFGKGAMAYDNSTLTRSLSGRGFLSTSTYAVNEGQNYIISSAMGIGQNASGAGNMLNGRIRKITYWPTRLTNAQMQQLTS